MTGRLHRLWRSIVGLPAWVRLWLVILAGTNMASLAFLDTEVGRYSALAFMLIGCFNMPTMFIQGGLTRLLSFPHFFWIPLEIYLLSKLTAPGALDTIRPDTAFALAIFTVNAVSLMFDVLESARWLGGRREILGLSRPI